MLDFAVGFLIYAFIKVPEMKMIENQGLWIFILYTSFIYVNDMNNFAVGFLTFCTSKSSKGPRDENDRMIKIKK